MRVSRQNAILRLINERDIETQTELVESLRELGYNATQATISRDIKELRLLKVQTETGQFKYSAGSSLGTGPVNERLRTILAQSIVGVDYAMNNVVIKTLSGTAQAAAASLDAMEWPEVVGTIAGDDTIMLVVRSEESAAKVTVRLNEITN